MSLPPVTNATSFVKRHSLITVMKTAPGIHALIKQEGWNNMPDATKDDLPPGVRNHLPPHAQDIFREAFNHAWEQYADPDKRKLGGTQEDAARRVAWAAVKRKYHKVDNAWLANV